MVAKESQHSQAGQLAALHIAVLQAWHGLAESRHASIGQRAVAQVQASHVDQLGQLSTRLICHAAPVMPQQKLIAASDSHN